MFSCRGFDTALFYIRYRIRLLSTNQGRRRTENLFKRGRDFITQFEKYVNHTTSFLL